MKIAVLNTGSVTNRKGAFNNVHERIKHLQEVSDVQVDVYLINHYDSWVLKLLRDKKVDRNDINIVDGVKYFNLWVKLKFRNYFLTKRLKIKDITCKSQLTQFVPMFKNYDLLSVHTLTDMYLAYLIKLKYDIPFITTWHGSDINIWPFVNKKIFETTKLILENANHNFFVSKKLLHISDMITKTNNKDFLYTGPAENFYKAFHLKDKIKTQLNITSKYIIGFIGNMVPVKNVLILPEIFLSINNLVEDVTFIVVGDGRLSGKVKKKMHEMGVENIVFTGSLEPDKIPEIMGCMDVLLLPSKNEGMPRVTLEALALGVNVVGSDVGGISESIGKENSFALDNDFVINITKRVTEILYNNEKPKPLSEKFSWGIAIQKEMRVYKSILNKI